jgi:hypothetical protein
MPVNESEIMTGRNGRTGRRTDLHFALLAIDHIVTTNNYKEGVWRRYPSQGGAVIPWSVFGDLLSGGKSLPEAIGEIIAGREITAI